MGCLLVGQTSICSSRRPPAPPAARQPTLGCRVFWRVPPHVSALRERRHGAPTRVHSHVVDTPMLLKPNSEKSIATRGPVLPSSRPMLRRQRSAVVEQVQLSQVSIAHDVGGQCAHSSPEVVGTQIQSLQLYQGPPVWPAQSNMRSSTCVGAQCRIVAARSWSILADG